MNTGQDYSVVAPDVRTRNLFVNREHVTECGVCFALVFMDRLHDHNRQAHPLNSGMWVEPQ